MNNYLEDLIKYLNETPREEILKGWAKSEELDCVGPSFSDFIQNTYYFNVRSAPPQQQSITSINDHLSPKFPSGFFLIFAKQEILKDAKGFI